MKYSAIFLIELGFNDTSILVGHFVSSSIEKEIYNIWSGSTLSDQVCLSKYLLTIWRCYGVERDMVLDLILDEEHPPQLAVYQI